MRLAQSLLLGLLLAVGCGAAETSQEEVSIDTALLRAALLVSDIERSKRFYVEALGYEPGFDGDITSQWVTDLLQLEQQQTVRFAILKGPDTVAGDPIAGAMIGLLEVSNPALLRWQRPEGKTVAVGEAILAMRTSDIDAVYARVTGLGATVLFGPQESVSGNESELVFYDPDGIRVHVVERHAPADIPQLVRTDGTYPVAPLEKDVIVVKVVQHMTLNIQEAEDPQAGLEENLRRMQHWLDKACSEGKKPDFVLFNEFPLTGYSSGPREEKLKYTIQIPGPETERVGEMAKACDTYIIFGSYARDAEWPGHILSLNPVINRQGEVVHAFWKTRNATRYDPSGEIPTTTIENVRDKFRERYGIEAEYPVLQTEFGNIAVSTVQLDPMVFAAFTMRGTEILFRTATGFSPTDVRAIAYYNNLYSAMSNMAVNPELAYADQYGGKSLIVGPGGVVLAQEPGNVEAVIEAEIPIAEFREGRLLPRYPMEMVEEIFGQFQQELPPNHLDLPPDELPQTRQDMKDLLDRVSRWLN